MENSQYQRITDQHVKSIKTLYYAGRLNLRTFVNPETGKYVPGLQRLPLRKVLKRTFGIDIDDFYPSDAIDAALRVSAALRNRRGIYAPVVVSERVGGIGYTFRKGSYFMKPQVPDETHIIFGPPEDLLEDSDLVKESGKLSQLEDEL